MRKYEIFGLFEKKKGVYHLHWFGFIEI